jgi:hypothetical protein
LHAVQTNLNCQPVALGCGITKLTNR